MSTLRPHTKHYDDEARRRLGIAVTRGREAAGHQWRPSFARAAGISVRSLVKIEQGEAVGPPVYEAVARALPTWTEDTPTAILAGGAIPSNEPPPEPDRTWEATIQLARVIAHDGDYLGALRSWRGRLSDTADIPAIAAEAHRLADDPDELDRLFRQLPANPATERHVSGGDS